MLLPGRPHTTPTHSPSRARVIPTYSSRRRDAQRSRSAPSSGGFAPACAFAGTSAISTCSNSSTRSSPQPAVPVRQTQTRTGVCQGGLPGARVDAPDDPEAKTP